jgi:hypothetical protein
MWSLPKSHTLVSNRPQSSPYLWWHPCSPAWPIAHRSCLLLNRAVIPRVSSPCFRPHQRVCQRANQLNRYTNYLRLFSTVPSPIDRQLPHQSTLLQQGYPIGQLRNFSTSPERSYRDPSPAGLRQATASCPSHGLLADSCKSLDALMAP